MATVTPDDEFRRDFPLWFYLKHPVTSVRTARAVGRRKHKDVDGEPEIRVSIVWPQKRAESAA